ncbi:hypothetical protein GYB59_03555 [bacterium]|nr:hypothetical protein [bacterium]
MLAVILTRFNPCGYQTQRENYIATLRHLRGHYEHIFPVELIFDGQTPDDPAATVIHGGELHRYIFQKERIFNQFARFLPKQFDKLLQLDADLYFTRTDWPELMEAALNRFDIVQPFERCYWADKNGSIFQSRKTIVLSGRYPNFPEYHPGFGWGFRRDVFESLGGFFDENIAGGGDAVFAWSLFGDPARVPDQKNMPDYLIDASRDYLRRVRSLDLQAGFANGSVVHRYHGDRKFRKYNERHIHLKKSGFDRSHLESDGLVWKWSAAADHSRHAMKRMFEGRREDD